MGPVADVNPLLESHDILVHCWTTPEPFGQVIIQAMAHSMPAIAPAHGGPAEILEGEPMPFLYPPGNAKQLADVANHVAPPPDGECLRPEPCKPVPGSCGIDPSGQRPARAVPTPY